MTAYYDNIAHAYAKARTLPYSLAKDYTYRHAIRDVAGKSVLDLGCGDGYYTRQLKEQGATEMVGVDLSARMIDLARQNEAKEPFALNIAFMMCSKSERSVNSMMIRRRAALRIII